MGLGCGVLVHGRFHRRGNDGRGAGGKDGGRQEVIGKAQGEPGQGVGRCRGDNNRVNFPGQGYVLEGLGLSRVEHRRKNVAVGYCPEGEGGDKLQGGPGKDDVHQRPGLDQVAGQLDGLVGRNASGYAEQDALPAEHQASFRFSSYIMRSPWRVISGTTRSMAGISGAMSSARPPVAITRGRSPSSCIIRLRISFTRPIYPK